MRFRRARSYWPAVIAASVIGAHSSPPAAEAAPSLKKAIWGPALVDGVSQFPTYADLGAGLYMTSLSWSDVARTRPSRASNPSDSAYRWPSEIDEIVSQASAVGIGVTVQVMHSPSWANGGRGPQWAPRDPNAYGRFLAAAAARYPQVRHWLIWGEPSKKANFLPPTGSRRYKTRAPRHYARLLAAAYRSLKRANRRNLVIGGNTYTVGDIRAAEFLRRMRLPSGRPPPMDLYGHNPFTLRRPNLARRPIGGGVLDFSDLDTVARLVDRNLGRRFKLFLAEFTLPTDHRNWEFNFWVTREVQASWLADALRITRRWSRIYTLAWLSLYDDPPRPEGDEVNRGLIDREGRKKPAYFAFRRG